MNIMTATDNPAFGIMLGACISVATVLVFSSMMAYFRYACGMAPSKLNRILIRDSAVVLGFDLVLMFAVWKVSASSGRGLSSSQTKQNEAAADDDTIPEGYNLSQTQKLARFSLIDIETHLADAKIIIKKGSANICKAYTKSGRPQIVLVVQEGDRLELKSESFKSAWESYTLPIIELTAEDASKINVRGAASVDISGFDKVEISVTNSSDFRLTANVDVLAISSGGMANMNAKVHCPTFALKSEGSSNGTFVGNVESFKIQSRGIGSIDASQLIAKTVKADLGGAVEVKVKVIDALDANVSGACNLKYYGDPSNVSKNISGIATIEEGGK